MEPLPAEYQKEKEQQQPNLHNDNEIPKRKSAAPADYLLFPYPCDLPAGREETFLASRKK
jgi:hypothetical protein